MDSRRLLTQPTRGSGRLWAYMTKSRILAIMLVVSLIASVLYGAGPAQAKDLMQGKK